jgi:hypothetical protein|tara:strand:+ start:698 stop:928 length:231 start_codon:yes stop_codon:yes gene_type:complete
MRAKTIPHVEYEIFNHLLDTVDIEPLRRRLCPAGDTVAKERFEKGFESAANLINNLCERRLHRLPEQHPDYKEKGE